MSSPAFSSARCVICGKFLSDRVCVRKTTLVCPNGLVRTGMVDVACFQEQALLLTRTDDGTVCGLISPNFSMDQTYTMPPMNRPLTDHLAWYLGLFSSDRKEA